MRLRYWTLAIAPGWLTYWALSHLVRPVWAVTAAIWVTTVAAFLGIVLLETRKARAEATADALGIRPTEPADDGSRPKP